MSFEVGFRLLVNAIVLWCLPLLSIAHDISPRGIQPVDWHNAQISNVSVNASGSSIDIEGKHCVTGSAINFNVLDEYAFDIDETLEVEVEFDIKTSHSEVALAYDGNGQDGMQVKAQLPKQGKTRWHRETFTLQRARFAGLQPARGTDFSLMPVADWFNIDWSKVDMDDVFNRTVTVCAIAIKRSYKTPLPTSYGDFSLEIKNEKGQIVPARIGLYDSSGRLPLPNTEALPIKYFYDLTRVVTLRPGGEPWPVDNRRAFYVDGKYHDKLSAGTYRLVVARGQEYYVEHKDIVIESNKTNKVVVQLRRWTDMSRKGWYSGDVHIHYGRHSAPDSKNFLLQTQAEDLHVANILQMGNIGATYYHQYSWESEARGGKSDYVLVPGQEDPRTASRGHTLHLNITEPTHSPERYYLYHEVFEKTHQQGGITGYAHVRDVPMSSHGMNHRKGMALDVPFGLVDLAEILSWVDAGVTTWFDFLNLGYKLSPAAGTDYPYSGDPPGAVRNYVQMPEGYSTQGWFEGLKAGHTFVTNGPMLELAVNGQGMGADIGITIGKPITVKAKSFISPEIDFLDRLELIEQGKVVASSHSVEGAAELTLNYQAKAAHGTWYVLRAYGKRQENFSRTVAISAPVYINLNGKGFCKLDSVPAIAEKMKKQLQDMQDMPIKENREAESWDMPEGYWPAQQALLQPRIRLATQIYDDIIARAKQGFCIQ